jgi:hypothetical protein
LEQGIVYLINLKHRKTTVLLLSILFFIAQTSVVAVIGVDTLGQLIFTFFGILSFISLESFTKTKKNYKLWRYWDRICCKYWVRLVIVT